MNKIYIYSILKQLIFIGLISMTISCSEESSNNSSKSTIPMEGGRVNAVDKIIIDVYSDSLDEKITISTEEAKTPSLILPSEVKQIGKFYRLGADKDSYAKESFIFAIPVPKDTDTQHLALAFLSQPQDRTLHNSEAKEVWEIISGVYSAQNNYFVTSLAFFAKEGRIVTLVNSKAYDSPTLQGKEKSQSKYQKQDNVQFKVSCSSFNASTNNRNITCSNSDEKDLETILEESYLNLQTLGFPKPYLKREIDYVASYFSIVSFGPTIIYGAYLAQLKPIRDVKKNQKLWPCGSNGQTTNHGGYSSGSQSFFVCIKDDGLSETASNTARHEFFHSIQYAYKAVRNNNKNLWITEGTATASQLSLNDMQRSTGRSYYSIDQSLVLEKKLSEYRAQDFWVYLGKRYALGLDYTQDFFKKGRNNRAIDETLQENFQNIPSLASAYWDWVKNQAFEKSIDLGDDFIRNLATCSFDKRMSDEDSLYFPDDLPSKKYTLEPLASKVIKIHLKPMGEFEYQARVNVKSSHPSATKVKFYEPDDEGTNNCYNKGEANQKNLLSKKKQSNIIYLLISNTSFKQEVEATVHLNTGSSMKIVNPQNNQKFEEGDIEFSATIQGLDKDTKINWSYIDAKGLLISFATSKNNEKVNATLCDGEYSIKANTSVSGNKYISTNVNISVRNPDSGILPAQCDWSIKIAEPTSTISYLSGELIPLRAVIDDDHDETDEPLASIVWRENNVNGTILGQGINSSTKFGLGKHTIYVDYGKKHDTVTINVVDIIGNKPEARFNSPESDNTLSWETYFDDASDKLIIPFIGRGIDPEDKIITNNNALTWAYREQGTATWIDMGKGTNTNLIISPISQHIEVRLIVTDSDGMEGVKIQEISILGIIS